MGKAGAPVAPSLLPVLIATGGEQSTGELERPVVGIPGQLGGYSCRGMLWAKKT